MLAVCLSLILTATFLAKGTLQALLVWDVLTYNDVDSVLEYLSREDADRAVKELDGKELRGRPVRVALDDSVRVFLPW